MRLQIPTFLEVRMKANLVLEEGSPQSHHHETSRLAFNALDSLPFVLFYVQTAHFYCLSLIRTNKCT